MINVGWVIGAALIGLIIGVFLGAARVLKTQHVSHPNRQELDTAQDRALLLMTFRRELANYMVRRDPDRFIELYNQAHNEAREISQLARQLENAALETQHTTLCEKHPIYNDFDLFGTREHVLYENAVNMKSLENIEAHYLDLVRFHALQIALDKDWKMIGPATSHGDLEHLKEYAQRIKDTKFKQRIIDAIDVFYRTRDSYEKIEDSPIIYENDSFQVQHAYDVASIRYGIHFKDTDEYGLYSFFVDDDRDKTYYSYYRSDEKYETEGWLEEIEFDGPFNVN